MDHSRNGTLMQTLTTSRQQDRGQELPHNIKHSKMTKNSINIQLKQTCQRKYFPQYVKIAPIQNSTEKITPSPRAIYFRGIILLH